MLQEKKKLPRACIKSGILIFMFLWWFWIGFILWFWLWMYFIYEKNIRKIKVLSISDILEISGVLECLNYMIWWRTIEERKNESIFPKGKSKYLDKMNEAIKKRALELKRKEEYIEKVKNNILKEKVKDLEELWQINSKKEDKKIVANTFSNYKISNNSSNKYNWFNSWKSVWDDYESVIDIMEKNK